MSKTGFVYIIENTENNEIYVGSTTKTIEQRFKQHIYDCKKNNSGYLHTFMNKVGIEKFSIRILKEVKYDDILELLAEESLFIKNYGTLNIKNNYTWNKQRNLTVVSDLTELVIQNDKVLSYEEFLNVFLDENTLIVIKSLNSKKNIKVSVPILNWLGYEDQYNFISMLVKNQVPFSFNREQIVMSSEDFKHVSIINAKTTCIKNYYILLEKLIGIYSQYLNLKLKNYNSTIKPSLNNIEKMASNDNNIKELREIFVNSLEYAPKRKYKEDAGADLTSNEETCILPGQNKLVHTGLRLEIPYGYFGSVVSRSGLAAKHRVFVLNAPGIIDAGYTGEILVNLCNLGESPYHIEIGARIAQLIVQPCCMVEFRVKPVEEMKEEEPSAEDLVRRGENGHGSTGYN